VSGQRLNLLLFWLLCLIWGSTWIATKAGLEVLPPLFMAGTRFVAAGAILLALRARSRPWRFDRADLPRLTLVTALIVVLCYGGLFWGAARVDSGTAAVLNMGLIPIALHGFGMMLSEEAASRRKLLGIIVGILGLSILFGPTAASAWEPGGRQQALAGAAAVALSSIVYAAASVLMRPLLRRYEPVDLSGVMNAAGGIVLLVVSLAVEPGAAVAWRGGWGALAWGGWLFLVFGGSLVAYTIYLRLLRDFGVTRAGMYAFVSPVVAVLLGVFVRDERLSPLECAGMVILLGAAWLTISVDRRSA